jgi:fluoride exporter
MSVSIAHMAVVAAGGALGSVARYLIAARVMAWVGGGFPFGTLAVNFIGCLTMGVLAEAAALFWSPSPELRSFLMVGVLGGLTTFSSFTLDFGVLWERNAQFSALLYLVASLVLTLGGFFAGMAAIRYFFPVGTAS